MFKDRKQAGKMLASALINYNKKKKALILAIPRGGVTVALEAAKQLQIPLDVIVIRKIGHPQNKELAIGAAGCDTYILNENIAKYVDSTYLKQTIKQKQQEVRDRYKKFRGKKPMYTIKDKTIILIDDGIATGATMIMAIKIIKQGKPKEIIVAIPVAPPDTVRKLERSYDKVICLLQPVDFIAIGQFYENFYQVEDEKVKQLLKKAWK